MQDQEQWKKILDIKVLVENKNLDMIEDSLPTDVRAEFDMKVCKSLSWVTKLVRILLVKSSKTY